MIYRIFLVLVTLLPLTLEAQGRNIFGVSSDNRLIRIDLVAGTETSIGTINIPGVQGLAHDPDTLTTYCITGGGTLCTIDLNTAEATVVQSLTGGPFDIFGIAVDRGVIPPKLYIVSNITPHTFFEVDISGSPPFNPTAVGSTGGTSVYGMAVDTNTTSLYAVDSGNNLLILNRANGSVDTSIGPTGQTDLRGLAYDTVTQAFFATTSMGQLLSLDGTGSATVIGATEIVSHITFVSALPPTPTPTPTATATVTATAINTPLLTATPTVTPGIVMPGIQPAAPEVSVDLTKAKPLAIILLQAFSGATKKIESLLLNAKKSKAGFRYAVVLKRTADASGAPIKRSKQDLRRITSKKNLLTVKNLKPNSNYNVKYRVEITEKSPGSPPRVVGKTKYSPTESFTIN